MPEQLELRDQVVAQYKAVTHLAESIASVHRQVGQYLESGHGDKILEITGQRSARIMEILGEILNEMDAVDEEKDSWVYPIFEAARRMFPTEAADLY